MVKRLGFDVVIVSEGTEAIREYRESHGTTHAFVAVIADLSVPDGMGGVECLEQLAQIDPEVKVIACSGHSSDPILLDHEARGFVAALEKPFRLEDMRRAFELADLAKRR